MNVTLEYSNELMATFTCTAFGGYYSEIEFVWSAEDVQNYSISTFEYVNSVDYSTTSIVTMTIHSTNNRRSQYSCCVYYKYDYYYYQSSFDENCETATINIGKKICSKIYKACSISNLP